MIGFVLAILLGLAGGLVFGWAIDPPQVANTTLDTLRADYQTDYVLMVAEAYPAESDFPAAMTLLKQLNGSNPVKSVQQALLSAQQLGYSEKELRVLAGLEMRLSANSESLGGVNP